jgi:alpha-1,6-mannosyltransferase
MFWTKFDYVLAERPEKVIGSWEVVHTVYGFGGVRLLKPGEESGLLVEYSDTTEEKVTSQDKWASKVAATWHGLEKLLRNGLLRGYWAEIRMEPKIHILQNQLK